MDHLLRSPELAALMSQQNAYPVSENSLGNGHSPLVSIIVVNYNGLDTLPACLDSLAVQTYPATELLLIDNGSTDGSLELVRREFPEARIVENSKNLGYSGAINRAAAQSRGAYITVLNMDVTVEPDWLETLVAFLEEHPRAGAANPQIRLADEPETINALGQNVHVTGLGFNRMLHYLAAEADREPRQVSGLQGAAFVIRRKLFIEIGGMNDANFMYHEDVDLSWLIQLAGCDVYCVPESIIYHKYTLGMKPWKYYYLERNRWALLLCVYRLPTMLLLAPFFLLTEAMMLAYCLRSGRSFFSAKLRAIGWNWQMKDHLRRRRAWIQGWRKRGDQDMLAILRLNYDWDQLLQLAR